MSMRKGQAAMEFLMTYGWAILVVLAAIGALAYFGVLSPDRFLPNKCTLSAGFSCTEFKVNTNGQIQMRIQNNLGVDVSNATITLTGKGANAGCGGGTPPVQVYANATVNGNDFGGALGVWDCGAALSGTKFQGDVSITYVQSGQTVSHLAKGTITGAIE